MQAVSTEGFERPESVVAGTLPVLKWVRIEDLLLDQSYQRPISVRGRRVVQRIARSFSWSCFSPVVVARLADGKFAIVDGQHRTTAAALVGFEEVPCQVVVASQEEQAAAFKAINVTTTPVSRMEMHAAGLVASDNNAMRLAEICARAEVQLLRYPVPTDRQTAGQTMAVGAISQCLRRYGEETLITAMQCVTQTTNNRPGVLSARVIKALCSVLHDDHKLRDSGLALFEAFDVINLSRLQASAVSAAAAKQISSVEALVHHVRLELGRRDHRKTSTSDKTSTLEASARRPRRPIDKRGRPGRESGVPSGT